MSDRELDALVAEKVMGWTRVSPSLEEGASPKYSVRRRYPHYSTSIADAWLVVEKMRSECWRLDLGSYYADEDGHRWSACFDNFSMYFRRDADTAPRAICLAALAAVGVEVTA